MRMFANVGDALVAHGMKYPNVVRTWIYVAHLLDWYGDMNRVRTAHYRSKGLGIEGGPAFPASTGIMGRSGAEECLMDVLAVENLLPGRVVATPINRSAKQHSSFNYGSSFSRAMALEIEGRRTIHVSGTASINAAGQITHLGDAEHQCLETLLSIAAILAEQGGGLKTSRPPRFSARIAPPGRRGSGPPACCSCRIFPRFACWPMSAATTCSWRWRPWR